MLFVLRISLLALLFGSSWCRPAPRLLPRATSSATASSEQETICGDIIDAANNGNFFLFYATDVYACLTSSTLAYLKNPPEGYQQPPIDVPKALEFLQQNVTYGIYQNQYDFEADLMRIVYAMHDAHITLNADVMPAFSFISPISLTAASVDGKSIPEVFVTSDITDSEQEGWKLSSVAEINGQDTVAFLQRFAAANSPGMLEAHADWNQLMQMPAMDIQGRLSVFSGSAAFYPSDGENGKLKFIFANGSNLSTDWWAVYNNPYPTGPLTTGGDFYNYFVLGLLPASYKESLAIPAQDFNDNLNTRDTNSNSDDASWYSASSRAYPKNPDGAQKDLSIQGGGILTGYFLRDISTGVLSVPSFQQSGYDIGNFSKTVHDFIMGAKHENLSKIIIDLQQNSGGNVELAFDTFRQFFPNIDPFAGSRRRSHSLENVLGGILTSEYTSLTRSGNTDQAILIGAEVNEWVITDKINALTGRNFSSWDEYYGPLAYNDDNFSLVERYDLKNEIWDLEAFGDNVEYDYHFEDFPNRDIKPSWNADHIIILTDGLCSSACALFLEMMSQNAGVRTLVMGGLPKLGPMQTASGSRGARAYSADALDYDIDFAINYNTSALLPTRNDTGIRTLYAGFNLRNQIQFKYLAADCRLYYTLANVYNISRLWRDVAVAAFDDHSPCVPDSTGYSNYRNSSTKAPPKPITDFSPPISIDLTPPSLTAAEISSIIEDNFPLSDGWAPRPTTIIQRCSQSGQCWSGSGCKTLLVKCSYEGPLEEAGFCLPTCTNRNLDNDCEGVDVKCDLGQPQPTKFWSVEQGEVISISYLPLLRKGLCMPQTVKIRYTECSVQI